MVFCCEILHAEFLFIINYILVINYDTIIDDLVLRSTNKCFFQLPYPSYGFLLNYFSLSIVLLLKLKLPVLSHLLKFLPFLFITRNCTGNEKIALITLTPFNLGCINTSDHYR